MTGDASVCDCWEPSECEGTVHCPPRCPRFVDKRGRPWLVEPYRPAYRDALVATYLDFAPDQRAQGLPPVTERRIEQWVDRLVAEGSNFVARSGEDVVGHAVYTPTDAAEPELGVFVHQDYQGRGLGTELARHVVATAAAGDRDALVLEVEPGNRAAISVYERLGFERVADSPGSSLIERRADPFRMRLDLAGPAALETQRAPLVRG